MLRRGLLLIACVAAVSACSPPMSSVMGVTADASGKPVGVVAVCDGHTDLAHLRVWDSPGRPAASPDPYEKPLSDSGEWSTAKPVTVLGTWSLTTGEPWSTERRIAVIEGYSYYLTGTGRSPNGTGNASLSIGIEFTLADVAALEPGQVRYAAPGDATATETTYAVVPLEDFRATVCG